MLIASLCAAIGSTVKLLYCRELKTPCVEKSARVPFCVRNWSQSHWPFVRNRRARSENVLAYKSDRIARRHLCHQNAREDHGKSWGQTCSSWGAKLTCLWLITSPGMLRLHSYRTPGPPMSLSISSRFLPGMVFLRSWCLTQWRSQRGGWGGTGHPWNLIGHPKIEFATCGAFFKSTRKREYFPQLTSHMRDWLRRLAKAPYWSKF